MNIKPKFLKQKQKHFKNNNNNNNNNINNKRNQQKWENQLASGKK